MSAYVKGSWLHDLIENFWKKLGNPDEIKRNKKGKITSKKKYSGAEEFVDYAKGKWKSIIMADKLAERKIAWRFEEEPWVILSSAEKICSPLFDIFVKEGPPLYSELPFDFNVGRYRIKGKIDEVRLVEGKIILRDYKSGKPWVGEMKLKHDPQLTIYNAGLCSLCYCDKTIARHLGVEGNLEKLMAGQTFISPCIEEQLFMIEALCIDSERVRTAPELIHRTTRDDRHFFEVLKMIEGTYKDIEIGNVYPERGKKCDDCDQKHNCDKELENTGKGEYIDKIGQNHFAFATPLYVRKSAENSIIQKKFRFRKPKSPK